MSDLVGLDYVTNCPPLNMTIRGSRPGQFHPFSSPTTNTEYRRSKNNFHVRTNCIETGFELTPCSPPPIEYWGWFKGSNTKINPAGKQRNTVRTNRGAATTAAAAAAQATAAAAASVQKRQSESEAPRVTPPPPPPPQLIGSPVMLTSQSSMPLPTSKSSPPMGSDWMRVNSVPPPTSLACTPPSKPAPPPPPNSYLQNPNPSPNPYTNVTAPASYMSANGIVGCNTPSDACPPPVQPNNAHNTTSTTTAAAPVSATKPALLTVSLHGIDVIASPVLPLRVRMSSLAETLMHRPRDHVSTSSTEERLVCPITNGNLWGPAVLEMDEEQSHRSPNDLQVRSFEFEINADYLDTIVKRLDLDIVVCSHLSSEPLQVCHWPDEAVNIRFNGTLLNLDRSTSVDGQPAHKVCCVKNLCRAGRNILEFILSTRNGLCMQTNSSLQASTGNTGIGGLKPVFDSKFTDFLLFSQCEIQVAVVCPEYINIAVFHYSGKALL
ncbi:unnamed protein product [Schistocephalus solidus]|uniref:SH2 domain-containing protein n=1 Tax=Schistocephalus solidus TaxID=70667 RepID=A0A183SJB4_SCHSO|nr:unnamed protein product [Schistocephalus solidus]